MLDIIYLILFHDISNRQRTEVILTNAGDNPRLPIINNNLKKYFLRSIVDKN